MLFLHDLRDVDNSPMGFEFKFEVFEIVSRFFLLIHAILYAYI